MELDYLIRLIKDVWLCVEEFPDYFFFTLVYTDCEKASSDQFYTNVASSTTSNDYVTDDDPLKRDNSALTKPNSTSIKYNTSNQVSTHEKYNPGGKYDE